VNFRHNLLPSEIETKDRSTWWLWISGLAALIFAGSEFAALWTSGSRQLWAVLPIFLAAPLFIWLLARGSKFVGGILLIIAIGLQSVLAPTVLSGLGIPNSLTSFALISGIGLSTLPRKFIGRVLAAGLIIVIASVLLDLFGDVNRPAALFPEARLIFAFIVSAIFIVFFAGEFLLLDLRTKIVTAILGTGGIALAILIAFALYQAGQTANSLTTRLDDSVRQLAEEQLINTAFIESNKANQEFEAIAEEVIGLAQIWISLRSHETVLNQAPYWDASKNLIQLDGGQYGNKATDTSSVFIPVGTPIDDAIIADLNVSAYLDFAAPAILQERPSLLALYAIDTRGVTRYYPNIDLASVLPSDFDTTRRPYFTIASPLFNPQRLPRWTIPYVDATGGGLVVTVAAPVYEGDDFVGVIAADMQLSQVTAQISSLKVGETGYAFMIDDAGRILSMPQAGFDMFGLRPEDMISEEFFKQTILGAGTDELQSVTRRMTAGGNGLLTVDVDGVDTYISFHPIETNGYSVALAVPVSELQSAIAAARNETQQQIQSAVRLAATLLIVLLVFAVSVSLGLGNVIAAPIQRLTQAASQVSAGDLTVQASATTSDEIGTLAQAFNTMTSRLRESLEELEKRVEERTVELSLANERNERRARQFEAIAHIARTISSTRDLDLLLSQITTVINKEFGFYHVGIFLLDTAKEYAVLSAANSIGGKNMLERGHRLKVGETGLVGFVTGTGKPRVALDTGADAVFFNNPDLPETRSEIALPLHVGDEIIGALDVQSTEPNAFVQEDINILSTLADQVSIAIQNAQQFEETRKALNESEILSRQFVQAGWQQFTKSRNLLGIRHTGARASLLHRRNGKDNQEDLFAGIQAKPNARGASLSLPIKLRGEVIGSVDVRTPDNRPWDQDELDIVTAIIERAAIALENARLLAESQKRAAKERIIGEISSKISMQSEINELLKTAAQELGRSLPGAEIAIQFNKDTE
jgi:GAF domain-containing protein/HAMP domain-containing protein